MNYQMKSVMGRHKLSVFILVFLSIFIGNLTAQTYPERPIPPKYCNDLANILDESQRSELEQMLKTYKDSTSTQIVIITIPDLQGMDKAQYTTELAEKWGVGQAKEDNGVVFMIAPKERKFFIATGRGTQDKLTDAFISRIGYNYVKPEFKQGNYFGGIKIALIQIIDKLSGKFKADPKSNQNEDISLFEIIMMLFVFMFLLWFISKISKAINYGETYSGRGYRGGLGSSLGGGLLGGLGGSSWSSGGSSSWGNSSGGDSWGGGSFDGGGAGGDW
jgi:uncharacterized protein